MTGNELKALRKAYGFPMHIWASLLGSMPCTVYRWEQAGDKQPPPIAPHPERMLGLLVAYNSPELREAMALARSQSAGDALYLTGVVLRHVYGDDGIRLPARPSSPKLEP